MKLGEAMVIAHHVRGRLRLRLRIRSDRSMLHAIEQTLLRTNGVVHVRVTESAAGVVVEYDPALLEARRLLDLPLDGASAYVARARIDECRLLPATPAQVWAALGEPESAALHLPSVMQIKSDGDGAWWVTLDLLGQRLQGRVELGETIPGERLELHLSGAVQGRSILSLTRQAQGTLVHEQVWYDLGGSFLDTTLGRMAEPTIRRLVRDHLASLERLLASPRAGSDATDVPAAPLETVERQQTNRREH